MSFNAVTEAFLAEHLGGKFEPVGEDFEGSSIHVPVGADGVPGVARISSVPIASRCRPSRRRRKARRHRRQAKCRSTVGISPGMALPGSGSPSETFERRRCSLQRAGSSPIRPACHLLKDFTCAYCSPLSPSSSSLHPFSPNLLKAKAVVLALQALVPPAAALAARRFWRSWRTDGAGTQACRKVRHRRRWPAESRRARPRLARKCHPPTSAVVHGLARKIANRPSPASTFRPAM